VKEKPKEEKKEEPIKPKKEESKKPKETKPKKEEPKKEETKKVPEPKPEVKKTPKQTKKPKVAAKVEIPAFLAPLNDNQVGFIEFVSSHKPNIRIQKLAKVTLIILNSPIKTAFKVSSI